MENRNLDFLVGLDSTRLACLYTSAANITGTFTNPTCRAYDHPQYWGHYLGHYLSASALSWASTGNTTIRVKSAGIVTNLGKCQQAWTAIGHPGYLFPYDPIVFARLERPPGNCQPVCVPFYVLHKMMAGLLDQYTLADNQEAFQILLRIAKWVQTEVEGVLSRGGENLWQRVLDTEWGGMNEVLYNLYAVTQDADHLKTGYYFNHYVWTSPLAINIDNLSGNHANTHIPEVIGDARGFEMTQNGTQKNIASNFFQILTKGGHSFATGGSNDHEYWGPAHRLGDQMNPDTEESCTTYNVLKLARHVYGWSADSTIFDFYERALFNGLIGNQNRLSPYDPSAHVTGFIYMLPVGGGGIRKGWGASNVGFPCCWGTLSETFSKLGDSIFFRAPDNSTIFVNLFASATLTWPSVGLKLTQTADFPVSVTSTSTLVFSGLSSSLSLSLSIRVPFWATGQNSIKVNGAPFSGTVRPGTYATISRTWVAGDKVEIFYPQSLRFERIDDNRSDWSGVGAIMYGAILLAGITDTDSLSGDPGKIDTWVQRTSDTELTFTAEPTTCASVKLIPLMNVMFERYAVYFHTSGSSGSVVHYDARGSVLPSGSANFRVTGGASLTPNGRDTNIRSGEPGETSSAIWTTAVQDPTHVVSGVDLTYRYVSGYGPAGRHVGSVFSIVIMDQCGGTSQVLYTSPELVDYSFDSCNTCYSPPQVVRINPGTLHISVTNPMVLGLSFKNNDRNVQFLLPLNATVYWQ